MTEIDIYSAIGRFRTGSDSLDPSRAAALRATLGDSIPESVPNRILPHFWHHIYFWDPQPPVNMGPDGHAKPGAFIPEFGMEQRMWAAGRLEPKKFLQTGKTAERRSTIEDIRTKRGRSGQLVFVKLRHDLIQDGLAVVERQQLVYRNASRREIAPAVFEPAGGEELQLSQVFDEVMLFRYSALTFNSHRIHYDVDYCRNVAGYPGLIVHGPLLATLSAEVAVRACGEFKLFSYRALSAAFSGETIQFYVRRTQSGSTISAVGEDGRLCMRSEASQFA